MHLLFSIVAMSIQKIKTLEEMIQLRAGLRELGKRLVFTNGCFDILHIGHVRYLNKARSLGDALAVGINSDRSVREIKGELRPIVPELERAEVLAALACVDFVFIFDDSTPKRVLDAIVPDILVKGADWSLDEIVGRDTVENAGGVVLNIPLVEGSSTTDLIRKVLEHFGKKAANQTADNPG
jgi:rfaE bifunctional protein nucleotidyltransferase chain/domain